MNITFQKTVTIRSPFVSWPPNILHTCNCWDGPKDHRLSILYEWRQTLTLSQSDCHCDTISKNCELAFSRASPPHRWAPFAAEQPPAGGWPGRVGVSQSWCWVTCSHLELIFSQRLQAVHLYQTLFELCSLYRFLENIKILHHPHRAWLRLMLQITTKLSRVS